MNEVCQGEDELIEAVAPNYGECMLSRYRRDANGAFKVSRVSSACIECQRNNMKCQNHDKVHHFSSFRDFIIQYSQIYCIPGLPTSRQLCAAHETQFFLHTDGNHGDVVSK